MSFGRLVVSLTAWPRCQACVVDAEIFSPRMLLERIIYDRRWFVWEAKKRPVHGLTAARTGGCADGMTRDFDV